jgi:hypothetical protein
MLVFSLRLLVLASAIPFLVTLLRYFRTNILSPDLAAEIETAGLLIAKQQ